MASFQKICILFCALIFMLNLLVGKETAAAPKYRLKESIQYKWEREAWTNNFKTLHTYDEEGRRVKIENLKWDNNAWHDFEEIQSRAIWRNSRPCFVSRTVELGSKIHRRLPGIRKACPP